MPYDVASNTWSLTPEMQRLQIEKKAGIELQERKHSDWDDNYELYRNKVKTNRLTQRQAVNIPLMKETIKTLLSRIDDPPEVEWSEMGGDEEKELYYQEVWNDQSRANKFELIDILDKKNVLLYGLSAKKLNIHKNGVSVSVLDVYDPLFDPLYNPWDLESARFIIHQNIFRSVREILADDRYSKEGKEELKVWADSPPGITQSSENKEQWEKKMERLRAMGVEHSDFPYFAGGDRVINLTEHYTKVWNGKEFEKRVVVYAENCIELLNETLEDLIGVDFWPFVVWSEDPETNDVYPDSVGDLVRTPNKVLNVWFSQLIENRTLKNFQMHWFLPSQNYTPQTYTPGPGVMLPAPPGDDINKVIKPVEISGLDDTLQAISAITQIVERGTGATAIEKGVAEKGTQTLGEVEILVGKATERATGMAKFYRMAWYELAWKWDKLMHANAPKVIKLWKAGRNGKVYTKNVFKSDWASEKGYEPQVRSSSEQEVESVKGIQKFMFILSQFPNNLPLRRIAQKRMLESVDLSPEELKEVEEGEKRMQEMMEQQQAMEGQMQQQAQQVQPQAAQPTAQEDLGPEIEELSALMNA
jgi:hypothetical protein